MTTLSSDPFTIEDMREMIIEELKKQNLATENDPKPLLVVVGEKKIE